MVIVLFRGKNATTFIHVPNFFCISVSGTILAWHPFAKFYKTNKDIKLTCHLLISKCLCTRIQTHRNSPQNALMHNFDRNHTWGEKADNTHGYDFVRVKARTHTRTHLHKRLDYFSGGPRCFRFMNRIVLLQLPSCRQCAWSNIRFQCWKKKKIWNRLFD